MKNLWIVCKRTSVDDMLYDEIILISNSEKNARKACDKNKCGKYIWYVIIPIKLNDLIKQINFLQYANEIVVS